MLGLERERLGEIGVEVGGALAGDAVDEIERDVVESGITKSVHGAPDVVRRGAALEHGEQVRLEALRAERDAVHPRSQEQPASSGVTVSGIRLDGQLLRRRQRGEQPRELAGSVNVGVPPPRKIVSTRSGEHAALERQLGEQRVDVRPCCPRRPTTVTKSQYPQRCAQNGRCT